MNCSDSWIPRDKSLFYNQHDTCLRRHVNAATLKCLEIQALVLSQNQIKILITNLYESSF